MLPEIVNVQRELIEYRWSSRFHGNPSLSNNMVNSFNEFERCLVSGEEPNISRNFLKQWARIQNMYADISDYGIENPLICWQIPGDEHMLSLVGNQRLCILRALDADMIPVWMVEKWPEQNQLILQYKKIERKKCLLL